MVGAAGGLFQTLVTGGPAQAASAPAAQALRLSDGGLKDTVLLWPGQSAKLQLTFNSHRWLYPYHCHMIDQSAMGMMAQKKIA
ncbi:multicopper oxidase domain-containing protein [Streptomyces sp. B21-083]